jgi:hypothetical protein
MIGELPVDFANISNTQNVLICLSYVKKEAMRGSRVVDDS